jgi:hypothetical protein
LEIARTYFAAWGVPGAKYDLTMSLEIAFDGPGSMEGHRIVPLLCGFLDIVEHVLMALEREMQLLGFVK